MRIIFLLLLIALPAAAQQTSTMGFWNVENMFDTIPSVSYSDDREYTPTGKQSWNTERYRNKCGNIARVIDDMALDIVGLAEVENEGVVRDLVTTLHTDYNYVHRTAGEKPRGRDVVLLYKGDRFIPHEIRTVDSRTSRTFLYVRGALRGFRVDIVVCHMPSMLNRHAYRERAAQRLCRFVDSLHGADPGANLIIMGDFNATPRDKVMRHNLADSLFCPLESMAAQGRGTYGHDGRWLLYDNIFMSVRLVEKLERAEIYIKPHLLYDNRKQKHYGYPRRTFTNGRYTNGFSDHLPVFLVINHSLCTTSFRLGGEASWE